LKEAVEQHRRVQHHGWKQAEDFVSFLWLCRDYARHWAKEAGGAGVVIVLLLCLRLKLAGRLLGEPFLQPQPSCVMRSSSCTRNGCKNNKKKF